MAMLAGIKSAPTKVNDNQSVANLTCLSELSGMERISSISDRPNAFIEFVEAIAAGLGKTGENSF